jgi:hypothetical protein
MARPQRPELARSARTDLDPDHVEIGLQGRKAPAIGGGTGKPSRPKATAANRTPSKATGAKSAPATSAPLAWPESAPAKDDLGPLADPPRPPEPIMVSLALLPLRETVKQLERLERRLTERLTRRGS